MGIDPGKLGALAFLDEGGRVQQVMPTPMRMGATREEYDLMAIRQELRAWDGAQLHVTVEKLAPMPRLIRKAGGGEQGGGSVANFNRGVAQGWAWMLTGLGIPFLLVLPQVWQARMLAPARKGPDGKPLEDTKARSIAAARQLWPDVDLRRTVRSRLDCDAYSDALLMAEFGRRRRLGGDVFAAAARA